MKYIVLLIGMIIYSTPAFAVDCGTLAPESRDRRFVEQDIPELSKDEIKDISRLLSKFRKRVRGERVVETCEGIKSLFTRERQVFSEELDVEEGLEDSYRFNSKLVERKGDLIRDTTYVLKVDDGQLKYSENGRQHAPVKVLALSQNELRYMRLFRVNQRGAGSSIFEIYYSISWEGKNVIFKNEYYANGLFFSEESAKLR